MNILAIDSSGLVASVAYLADGVLKADYTVNDKKTHSQTLLPMTDIIKNALELDFNEIDAVAVAAGPGSFTGLRIGAATAKGLAFALDIPLIPVPTVDALAYNLCGAFGLVCPLMNARRSQTYTGVYRFSNGAFEVLKSQRAVSVDEILDELAGFEGEHVTFLGDGVEVFKGDIAEKCVNPHSFALPHQNLQRAACVGVLGEKIAREKRFTDPDDFEPIYLRLSQAERERLEKQKSGREG